MTALEWSEGALDARLRQSGVTDVVEIAADAAPAAALAPAPTLAISALQCADHALEVECRYQVAWSINPHMAIGAVEFARAAAQHAAFVAALEGAGVGLVRMPFIHGAYDSVFAKDPALLLERRGRRYALLALLRYPERQRELDARAAFYAHQGFEVVCDRNGPTWEGGDVVMLPSGAGMFLGTGLRTRREASRWLERHAGVPVWPLELCDPYLYHLDMVLTILPDGTAIVCNGALTSESLRVLERVRGIRQVIRVGRDIALAFGLNVVALGDVIVHGAHVPSIEALVRALGYRSVVVPLGQFHLAGGSAACLVATVHRDPLAAR